MAAPRSVLASVSVYLWESVFELGNPRYSSRVKFGKVNPAPAPFASEVVLSECGRGASRTWGAQLRYTFEAGEQYGAALSNPLVELLGAVTEGGSITHAARILGCSYRHVWGALRKWERILGKPLVSWAQGRKARPTEFAQRLIWAERRARQRMQPHIEALRADLTQVLVDARDLRHQMLSIRASHDLALPVLQHYASRAENLHLDLRFQGSSEALQALNDRQCLVAGFHVPVRSEGPAVFVKGLNRCLKPRVHRLIACSRRVQGLMVRKEHEALVRALPDLARHQLRFVNRQPGSGTRMLVDQLMCEHGLLPAQLRGYTEQIEQTHIAVALCVASGVADAGVGIEAAALQFGLCFVPLVEESYFLACATPSIDHPAIHCLRKVLAGERWQEILAGLPGYRSPDKPGGLLTVEEALPWWRTPGTRRSGSKVGVESL